MPCALGYMIEPNNNRQHHDQGRCEQSLFHFPLSRNHPPALARQIRSLAHGMGAYKLYQLGRRPLVCSILYDFQSLLVLSQLQLSLLQSQFSHQQRLCCLVQGFQLQSRYIQCFHQSRLRGLRAVSKGLLSK